MCDWLGTGKVANSLNAYRPFREARAFAQALKLKSQNEWYAFSKGKISGLGRLPTDIPATPQGTYAHKGWKGFGDWLGTGAVAPRLREFRPFQKARVFSRKLKLKSQTEWFAYCKGAIPRLGRLPKDVPTNPNVVYARKGWKGMGDWLETGRKRITKV